MTCDGGGLFDLHCDTAILQNCLLVGGKLKPNGVGEGTCQYTHGSFRQSAVHVFLGIGNYHGRKNVKERLLCLQGLACERDSTVNLLLSNTEEPFHDRGRRLTRCGRCLVDISGDERGKGSYHFFISRCVAGHEIVCSIGNVIGELIYSRDQFFSAETIKGTTARLKECHSRGGRGRR